MEKGYGGGGGKGFGGGWNNNWQWPRPRNGQFHVKGNGWDTKGGGGQKGGYRKRGMFGLDSHDINFMAGGDGQGGGPAEWNAVWEDEEVWMLSASTATVSPIAVANNFVELPITEHESSECIACALSMDALQSLST